MAQAPSFTDILKTMCGIAGIISTQAPSEALPQLQAMLDITRHRGPDDQDKKHVGTLGKFQVYMGHNRLSIIDLSALGRQPMSNEDGTVWLTFNGEIYNYRELKKTCGSQHQWRGHSDSESLIHYYEDHPDTYLKALNGMFAFAIFDQKRQRLELVRDQAGIKPLYTLALPDGGLAFASEIKALLTLLDRAPQINPKSLAQFFTLMNAMGSATLYQGIELLPAGQRIVVGPNRQRRETYWNLSFEADGSASAEVHAQRVATALKESVARQNVSDVPLGAFLSGGIDSSAVCALVKPHHQKLDCFTIGFEAVQGVLPEQASDEASEAVAFAKTLDLNHHVRHLGPEALAELLVDTAYALEEPRVGISYQNLALYRMTRQSVTVCLSGVGGDELFAGYPWRYQALHELSNSETFLQTLWQQWQRMIPIERVNTWVQTTFQTQFSRAEQISWFENQMEACQDWHPIDKTTYFDFTVFLNGLLLVEDKLAMSCALEVRVPLLDQALIALASHIPPQLKFDGVEGKQILRSALRHYLPAEVLQRRKQGFIPPDATWFRTVNRGLIMGYLLREGALLHEYFTPRGIAECIALHDQGTDQRRLLWSWMVLETCLQIFVAGKSKQTLQTELFKLSAKVR